MKTLGSYLLDKIFIRHFFLNQGVQTSEKILKACGYPNSSLVNTATCSKMNQDKNTEEEEQSKQKHAVTSWHAIKKNSKVITFWLSHMVDFRSRSKIREELLHPKGQTANKQIK